jgi:hypothetical protein
VSERGAVPLEERERLRELAEKAEATWGDGFILTNANDEFLDALSPDVVLRLLAMLDDTEKTLREIRAVFPMGVCSECRGFEYEVSAANNIIDAALARLGAGGDSG